MRSIWLSLDVANLPNVLKSATTTSFGHFAELADSHCFLDQIQNSSICNYIKASCNTNFFFIAESYYCSEHYPSFTRVLGISLGLLIAIAVLIAILSIIVSSYLLFSVTNLTDFFGINHKVLSFLIIPLTNSLPDLFNFHLAMKSNSVDLVLGQVIGANLVTFTIIIGIISILFPFSIAESKAALGNFACVSITFLLLTYIISDSKVTFLECLTMICAFICYITFLTFERFSLESEIDDIERVILNKGGTLNETTNLIAQGQIDRGDDILTERYSSILLKFFWRAVDLFWGLFDFLIFMLIPVSNNTVSRVRMLGETSYWKDTLFNLSYFHLFSITTASFLLNFEFFDFSFKVLSGVIISTFAIVELSRERTSSHLRSTIVDIFSIVEALLLISIVTGVIIQLLKNLGALWKLSEYSMGLLVFSIVNSVNDIMMNISLARNFSPILGLNSCLGTSLLITLVGIGFNGVFVLVPAGIKSGNLLNESLSLSLSSELHVSTVALNVLLLTFILYIPLNGWKFDQKLGILAILFWVLTNCACLMIDFSTDGN